MNKIQENTILISVLMPVFNMESSVKSSITSILNQTYQNFEFLIVDDASTDNTWQILENIKSNKISLFRFDTNKGRPYARNFLLSKAKGDYIAWLDADDYAFQTRLEKQLACLASKSDLVCVSSYVELCSVNNCMTKKLHNNSELIKAQLLFKSPLVFSSIMHRNIKELFFDETLLRVEDTSFLWQLSFYGHFYCIKESLVKYNWSNNHYKIYENSLTYIKKLLADTIALPANFPIETFVVLLREPKKLSAKEISNTLFAFRKLLPIIRNMYPEIARAVNAVFVYEVIKCSYLHSLKNLRYLIFANPVWVYQLYKSKY